MQNDSTLTRDADYFGELQTQTGWGRTLKHFAEWCSPDRGWTTLDVGCGPGLLPGIFSSLGCKAIGVDLDLLMFCPAPLYKIVVAGDVNCLPFATHSFDLVTATNVLFLLRHPLQAVLEIKRVLRPGGKMAMLNPSEHLHTHAAQFFSQERGLAGLESETFLNWAKRAEENYRWTEEETIELFSDAGLRYIKSFLKIGPGFARFAIGTS